MIDGLPVIERAKECHPETYWSEDIKRERVSRGRRDEALIDKLKEFRFELLSCSSREAVCLKLIKLEEALQSSAEKDLESEING